MNSRIKSQDINIGKLTIAEAYDMFYLSKKVQNLSAETLRYYDEIIRYFNKYHDTDHLCIELNEDVIIGYKEYLLEKDINEQTVYTRIKGIRTILYYFMERGFMEKFVIHQIKVGTVIKDVYTDEELDILLRKPSKNHVAEYRTWVMINFFYGTGVRLRTLSGMYVKDLDLKNEVANLRVIKNRHQQIIPVSHSLINILKEYITYFGLKEEESLFKLAPERSNYSN